MQNQSSTLFSGGFSGWIGRVAAVGRLISPQIPGMVHRAETHRFGAIPAAPSSDNRSGQTMLVQDRVAQEMQ
jgi:hypothetical protein